MKLLEIKGVDITPFIALKGYKFDLEDLEASAERSIADGSLTRDRLGRFAVIEVQIKAMLGVDDVALITSLGNNVTMSCKYFNYLTKRLETGTFYVKIKSPSIYSTANDEIKYEGFSISLKATTRYIK